MTSTLNLTEVRESFPALKGEQVYLDNAGGSQTLGTVADKIHHYLLNTNVQLGASYLTGQKSTAIYNNSYEAASKYINAPSADHVVLGSSTTQLFRNVSLALSFSPGDELIISSIDHEANIAPWVSLAARQNLSIKWWHPNTTSSSATKNPKLLASDLSPLLSPKTRLVTCTHASNILGTIHDIKSISSLIHSYNSKILLAVDGVAYAPHRPIDVQELGVDFYSFSWYKVYGPHISMLYASPLALSLLESLGHFFNGSFTLQEKLGLAGSSYELVGGIEEVTRYLDGKWEGMEKQEGELQEKLLGWLNGNEWMTVWGERSVDTKVRVPTVSFTIEGWSSKEFVEAVEGETGGKFGFRWGSFYSVRLVGETLGLDWKDGVVRVSLVHYNTLEEVGELIEVFEKVLSRGKGTKGQIGDEVTIR
ncbi:pyridoxal phosphate-dependent transferase [Podospora fimiseda]|uniref:Pyridoxal phosphate-dependent transferase n=1 Tax=Podospora fimiseda TaxID=252190 RepID=A0AAN7BWP9_9PEZI|nr:pyridoxal phosphate-dependent transferase [Podospora fimiseda]